MQRKALRAKRWREFAPGWGAATALSCALAVATSLFGQGQNKAQNLKKAQHGVQQGEKAEAAGHWDDALTLYDAAAKDAPGDLGIMGHAAALRAKLVRTHTDAAENAAINGDLRRATEELRTALKIDPGNTFLAEREAEMRAMNEEDTLPSGPAEQYKLKGPPLLAAQRGVKSFSLRGDTRSAYEQAARAFGVTAAFDPDLVSKNVKLRMDGVDFETAMRIIGQQTTTFFRPLTSNMIFVAADTIEKRKQYGIEVEETFVLSAGVDSQDLTEMLRTLREITSANHIELDLKSKSVTIRDSAEKVKLAGTLIKQAEQARSELMLEIELLEVDKNRALDLGLVPPTTASAIPLSGSDVKSLLQATDLANLLTLVQQVFAAHGISPVPPVIPVGGGRSTFLLNLPSTSANFSDALSLVRNGRKVLLRVQDTKPATFFAGQRFPVTLSLLSTSLGGTTVTGAIPSTVFPRTDFTVGQVPVALAAQDFNNDSQKDLAVVNQQDNSVSILLNQGNGNFSQPNPAIVLGTNETGPAAIASGVFRLIDQTTNLTQPADLVIANSTSNTVTVLLGNGDGTFAEAPGSPFAVGLQPRAVVIADFDNDGSLDFAVADSNDNTIATFQGHGDGTFTPFPKSPFVLPATLQGPVAMVSGNFQNLSTSGPDLAVIGELTNNVAILESQGQGFDGTFTLATGSPFATGNGPIAIASGDLNSDGVPDLAVVNSTDSTISVFLNNGDATFAEATGSPLTTSAGANPSGVAIADFTNDGIGDIAVTNQGVSTLGVYVGLGFGTYSPQLELSTPTGPQAVIAASLDATGLPDAAITAHSGTSNVVSVFLDPSTFSSTGSAVQVPYPGSEYIDLGLKIKATPYVHGGNEVTLQMEFEIRSLAGSALNGIPVINNQTLNQTIRLKQDETTLVGGLADREAAKSLASLPGLGEVPGLGYAAQNRNNTSQDTELLILITPRKLRIPPRLSKSIYAGPNPGAGTSGPGLAPQQPQQVPQPQPQQQPETSPQPVPNPPQR
ncbi:MAG TPA: FG-GAP-like repeat-containing protein [Candidatus Angelobacter sp.]|nr:FG-GAP-like repeat-containing protein [Candidatus Angelobacter sp.]